jgi:hypothetical protein
MEVNLDRPQRLFRISGRAYTGQAADLNRLNQLLSDGHVTTHSLIFENDKHLNWSFPLGGFVQ